MIFLVIKVLTQIKRKGYMWKTSQKLKILPGLASDESESMTIREGKIRETNELSYRSYAERSRRTSGQI